MTREVVVKTAKLAQFEMSEEELDRMTSDFKGIIGFVEQVRENACEFGGTQSSPLSRFYLVTNAFCFGPAPVAMNRLTVWTLTVWSRLFGSTTNLLYSVTMSLQCFLTSTFLHSHFIVAAFPPRKF